MLAGNFGINRRSKLCLTSFTIVFCLIYVILAFDAVQFATVSKKSTAELQCKCQNINPASEATRNLAGVSLLQPSVDNNVIHGKDAPQGLQVEGNSTNPQIKEKKGEFLKFSESKGLLILEDEFEALSATEKPPEKPHNKTKKRGHFGDKFYHIYKPKPGVQMVGVDKQQGIVTRFGFIKVSTIDDHSFLTKSEVEKFSKYFIFDQFSVDAKNKSTKEILTYSEKTEKYENWTSSDSQQILQRPLCPLIPPNLKGKINRQFEDLTPPSLLDIRSENPEVKLGGRYTPPCHPRSKIAIIVPFRGREGQLQVLLAHMHPIWQRQQIDYTVYTISQADDQIIFNKAKLMNIGFTEASKHDSYDCFVFHDVDMTLEDDRCLYRCPDSDNARELSVYLDKFDYQELKYHLRCRPRHYPESVYAKYFGGVAMMTSKQILDVNGYSNLFWGWGSEDIDMYLRLWKRGYRIVQPHGKSCSYHMIKHDTESSNKKNEGRFALLANSVARMRYEGLTSLRYRILSTERLPLYTNITVDIGQPKDQLVDFMTRKYTTFEEQCDAILPWQ